MSQAFSAPRGLIKAGDLRAAKLQMTRSGYYRYVLAKDLGYSEEEAREIGQHGAVVQFRQRALSTASAANETAQP